jgi:hypothetical protein
MTLPGPFTPTHQAPGTGLAVWASPDPSAPAVANLDPGLPVQVVQRWGDWASIVCSNGWGGWVDGRALLPTVAQAPPPAVPQAPPPAVPGAWAGGAGPHSPPPPAAAAPGVPQPPPAAWPGAAYGASAPEPPPPAWPPAAYGAPVPGPPAPTASWAGLQQAFRWPPPPWLAGAALVLLGVVFSWADLAGTSGTGAFDIPIQFLFDREKLTGGIKVGLLMLVLLGLGVVAWARPHHPVLGRATGAVWGKAVGGVVLLVAAAFALQWHRFLGLYPSEVRPGYLGSLGFGLYLTIAGGALLIVGDRPWPKGRR